jgi:hypothetical protein
MSIVAGKLLQYAEELLGLSANGQAVSDRGSYEGCVSVGQRVHLSVVGWQQRGRLRGWPRGVCMSPNGVR